MKTITILSSCLLCLLLTSCATVEVGGPTNSFTNKVWAYTNNIGWYTNVSPLAITNALSGLLSTSQYYYAFSGSNAATKIWDSTSGVVPQYFNGVKISDWVAWRE